MKGDVGMLIDCPECGAKISNKAHFCVHCGFPFDNNININTKSAKLPENMLTINDIQKHLIVSHTKAYKIVKLKGFPKITRGHRYYIPKEKYEKWIEENLKHTIIL